jgi:succinate-acetate transporter protein
MSTDARTGGPSDAFAELLRGSLWPTLVAAVVCIAVGLVSSPRAAWSAALGAGLVVGFFSLTLLVMRRTADLPPTTVMLVVMVTYTVKVLVLGVVMFAVRDVSWLSGYAVGVTITVCALVWLFFELRAYKRLRIFTYDPNGAAALPSSEDRP